MTVIPKEIINYILINKKRLKKIADVYISDKTEWYAIDRNFIIKPDVTIVLKESFTSTILKTVEEVEVRSNPIRKKKKIKKEKEKNAYNKNHRY